MDGENPVFPVRNPSTNITYSGISIRGYFAAKAMQGFISNSHDAAPRSFEDVCERSVAFADELIKQLNINSKK